MVAAVPAALFIVLLYPLPLAYSRLEFFVAEDSLNRQITFVGARHLYVLLVQESGLVLGLCNGCSFVLQPYLVVGGFVLAYLLLLESHSAFFGQRQRSFEIVTISFDVEDEGFDLRRNPESFNPVVFNSWVYARVLRYMETQKTLGVAQVGNDIGEHVLVHTSALEVDALNAVVLSDQVTDAFCHQLRQLGDCKLLS